jgi:hypothetical protein
MMLRHWTGVLACGMALLAGCSDEPNAAVPDPTAGSNGVCLRAESIDHTEVADDSTILFITKDHKVWKNSLPFPCTSLKFEGGFAFATDADEICSNAQTIRVLRSGTFCELGQFTPAAAATGPAPPPGGEGRPPS